MSSLIILSVVLSLLLYIPLCIQIITGEVKQNFATFLLWTILDGITTIMLIMENGNYFLAGSYTIGSAVVMLCIAKTKNVEWTWFESFVTFLIGICLVIWRYSDTKTAIIVSTLAMIIAGLPQLRKSYQEPWNSPLLIYLGYFVANCLSVLGGKNWSIEEIFYPICLGIYSLVISVVVLRKLWLKPTTIPGDSD